MELPLYWIGDNEMDNTKKILEKYGLKVILDKSQVFLDNPGDGTPAMVYNRNGASATYACACGEGELENFNTGYMNQLTELQIDWLNSLENEIGDFLQW